MRNYFDEQLEKLNIELITMGSLCEEAISISVKALLEDDTRFIAKVEELENEIDRKEREIEGLCMRLLLQQQPVACDLRMISSAMKMISDMERIGDQASDMAEIAAFVKNEEVKSRIHIHDMADAAVKMVTDSVESFVKKDIDLAGQVIKDDDKVDELFNMVKNEIVELIASGDSNGESCIDLFMAAKYLERIGDHAVNIAERVQISFANQPK
ncbi:MAG: phosphate signaling complex protein PhoU [Oscillospiraceae bacterium]|nr:phosphate signaling complex protein PhoU [Oscillospiraceae bacterium]